MVTAAREHSQELLSNALGKISLVDRGVMDYYLQKNGLADAGYYAFATAYTHVKTLEENLRDKFLTDILRNKYSHMGVGTAKGKSGSLHIATVIFTKREVKMEPFPQFVNPEETYLLRAEILGGNKNPQILMTTPRGEVREIAIRERKGKVMEAEISFREGQGRYKIEIMGEDLQGPKILALFPVYLGVDPPDRPELSPFKVEMKYTNSEEAEKEMVKLINRDRKRHKLSPLPVLPELSEIARQHSKDMRDNNFFAHYSPRSGTPHDRIARSSIAFSSIKENIAQDYSLKRAEQHLMESPGHRLNIIDPKATHVGVGIVFGQDPSGAQIMHITQNFIEVIGQIDPLRVKGEILNIINRKREEGGFSSLKEDLTLSSIALKHSQNMLKFDNFSYNLSRENKLLDMVEKNMIGYRKVAASIFLSDTTEEIPNTEHILDPSYNYLGIGLVQGDSGSHGKGLLWITLIFMEK
ncbi:MAG: hypothetical protein JSU92_13255 [Deltaproteobacteria bacterium]|nr:MAG: hypothetical protein JSU92_13255 [Deltaproteobacteria bacterium]